MKPGDPTDRQQIIAKMVTLTGGRLERLTAGEPRSEEKNWLVPVTRQIFQTLAWLAPVSPESGTKYWHYPLRKLLGFVLFPIIFIRVKMGKMPKLPYSQWAREDAPLIRTADPSALPMRGIPTPKALKLFSGIPLFGRLFEDMVARQIEEILEDNPDTVIQFELPAELAFTSAPIGVAGQRRIARRMATSLERVIRQTRKGTRFSFHLCWGDLGRRPFVRKFLQSNLTKVILINAIAELSLWDEEWILDTIHDPMCDGVNNPAENERSYDVYYALVPLPDGTRYALGILRTGFNAADTYKVALMLEERLATAGVQLFALAAPCGDARKPDEEVREQYATALEVIALLEAA